MPVPGVLPRLVPDRQQPFVVDGKIVPSGVRNTHRFQRRNMANGILLVDYCWYVCLHDAL